MTPEQEVLLFKARRNIDSAFSSLKDGFFETAINRAYYAMFDAAQALLLSDNRRSSKHWGVISIFGKDFAKAGRIETRFHQYLIEAFEARQISDYATDRGVDAALVPMHVDRAEEFVTVVQLLLKDGGPQE